MFYTKEEPAEAGRKEKTVTNYTTCVCNRGRGQAGADRRGKMVILILLSELCMIVLNLCIIDCDVVETH